MGYVTSRIYYCSGCGSRVECKRGETKECPGKDCERVFGSGQVTSNGGMYINMNPMSRRTDIEFGEMSVSESADRMRNASYENRHKKETGGRH